MDDIFYEIFEFLPRQGPGDDESTKKAFEKLVDLPDRPEILDVGCGTGGQTVVLAKISSGNITALDIHVPFIETLRHSASQEGVSEKIHCLVEDMAVMNFPEASFDVIWSEGSIFIVGFENGLKSWKPFLKPGGFLVVSELVWVKREIPQEAQDFFDLEYPPMKHYEDLFPVIKSAGYEVIASFLLPTDSWWINYYGPAEKRVEEMRVKYKADGEVQQNLDIFQKEIEIYKKYSEYYGYYFYIMRKPA